MYARLQNDFIVFWSLKTIMINYGNNASMSHSSVKHSCNVIHSYKPAV
jgi:hypothetical protein